MKWYYEWRLNKVRAEISALEEATRVRLIDDYTGHSRLRVLRRMVSSLQQRLGKYSTPVQRDEGKQITGELKQTTGAVTHDAASA